MTGEGMMGYLELITRPTLLLDRQKAIGNMKRMADKARANRVRQRPHFKTHQSAEIGEWFREFGTQGITVSSVDMALGFAKAGWDDITIAFPVNLRQMADINDLADRVKLGLLVESADTARKLAQQLTADVDVWLKIDAGYGRTGIHWQNKGALEEIANTVAGARNLSLKGILTHSGNTYGGRSAAAVRQIFKEAVGRLRKVQVIIFELGYSVEISVGDTPGCSLAEEFKGIDEIRPGNYVFYDLMQWQIGACGLEDIAVALACPVVALHPDRGRIVVHGGAVHLSKDVLVDEDGERNFGRAALLNEDGWTPLGEEARVVSISQEHGIIQADEALINSVKVGDVIGVLPVHSCLTADLLRRYLTLDGEWVECIEK
jgi:D-serine deaminase-like pyridoxal phosphate-dependent protein